MQTEIQKGINEKVKIIFIDEAVFSFNTFAKKSWSLPYANISVVEQKIKVLSHAIIAGISEDKGLEAYLIKRKSIKTEEYV